MGRELRRVVVGGKVIRDVWPWLRSSSFASRRRGSSARASGGRLSELFASLRWPEFPEPADAGVVALPLAGIASTKAQLNQRSAVLMAPLPCLR